MTQVVEKRLDPLAEPDQKAAQGVQEALREAARIVAVDGREIPIPAELAHVFEEVAAAAAAGELVRFTIGEPAPLTARQAAEALGMSRTTLCKLMDRGEIGGTYVGTHRRIEQAEVDRVRRERARAQAQRYAAATSGLPDVPDAPMQKLPGRAAKRPGR